MPYYGLLYTDIVNSFSQAKVEIFAVGATIGQSVINAEIAFQYEKLQASLPEDCLSLLQVVPGEVVIPNVSGGFDPSLYADPATIRAYVVPKNYSPCAGSSLESGETCFEFLTQQLNVVSANISSAGSNHYVLLDSFDSKTQNLVVYYNVDQVNVTVQSLKSVLRDMVCFSLGSRIYPSADADMWSIVRYYGEEADKWLKLYMSGKMPAGLASIKLIGKTRGMSSIRLSRA